MGTATSFIAMRVGHGESADGIEAPPSSRVPVLLCCEGEYWTISGFGAVCRIRSTRGVEMLSMLVNRPRREHHVLDLAGIAGPVDGGDSGQFLDIRAQRTYLARLAEARTEYDDAIAAHDGAKAARVRLEIESLEEELGRSTGRGGSLRRTSGAVERARVNVQRRLADAIRRISAAHPLLGAHFKACVRTGTYCTYAPERAGRLTSV
jgi:hypothetical protein